jgi:hypothetical protein
MRSREVSLVKPDPGTYELGLARLGVSADQALFADDREDNIGGAARLGLKTLHFVDEQAVARQPDLITSWDIHEVLDDRSSGEQHDRRPAVAAGRRGKPRVFLEARVGIGRGMALLFLSSHHRAGDD